MKKLMITLAAGLVSALTFAAQCAGTTLEGARCKREAAEGSKYCIGHAHQAKPSAQSKEKDDGHCALQAQEGRRHRLLRPARRRQEARQARRPVLRYDMGRHALHAQAGRGLPLLRAAPQAAGRRRQEGRVPAQEEIALPATAAFLRRGRWPAARRSSSRSRRTRRPRDPSAACA